MLAKFEMPLGQRKVRNGVERIDLNGALQMLLRHEGNHQSLSLIFLKEKKEKQPLFHLEDMKDKARQSAIKNVLN